MLKNIRMRDTESELSQRTVTENGYLQTIADLSRGGIYSYLGEELGMTGEDASKVLKVFRPKETVFDEASLSSFSNLPITNDHPPELLTSVNTKQYAVGYSGDSVERSSNAVRARLTITDQATINDIYSGKTQISLGYNCDYEETPGQTLGGDAYDLVQTNIVGNHIAIVESGRAGEGCKIFDNNDKLNKVEKDMAKIDNGEIANVVKKAAGGKEMRVEPKVQDEGTFNIKAAIQDESIGGDLKDILEYIVNALEGKMDMDDEVCEEDAEMENEETDDESREERADVDRYEFEEGKEAERKEKRKSSNDMNRLVTELVSVREKARKLAPTVVLDGKSAAKIRRDVVRHLSTSDSIQHKSDDHVEGRFEALEERNQGGSYMMDQLARGSFDRRDKDVPLSAAQEAFKRSQEASKR